MKAQTGPIACLVFTFFLVVLQLNRPEKQCLNPQEAMSTIHIAMIVGTERADTVEFAKAAILSILFYSEAEIHFHLVTDTPAKLKLANVFEQVNPLQGQAFWYKATQYLDRVSWLKTKHHSGRYALLKMLLPDIIPLNVEKVIYIDADIAFSTNIKLLWNVFREFSDKQLIGMAELGTNYFNRSHTRSFNILGRGFNNGIMLLQLAKMRWISWNTVWTETAEEAIAKANLTRLPIPDQDIFNLVIANNPGWVHILPCGWNIQLTPHTGPDYECLKSSLPLIIHYNSPDKLSAQVWEYYPSLRNHMEFVRNLILADLQQE